MKGKATIDYPRPGRIGIWVARPHAIGPVWSQPMRSRFSQQQPSCKHGPMKKVVGPVELTTVPRSVAMELEIAAFAL
jgi:hypothetical protein